MTEKSRLTEKGRSILIWIFGLLASGIVGGMIGAAMGEQGAFGLLAGLFGFACVRLWLPQQIK
jgi:hypothetical protein